MAERPEPISVRIPDACRMTGIGRSKLYELIAEGEIAIVKVGTMTLVPVAGLKDFIARQPARLLAPRPHARSIAANWGRDGQASFLTFER